MKLTRKSKLALAGLTAVTLSLTSVANAKNVTLVVGGASSVASIMGQCKAAYTSANDGDSFAYASSSSGQGQKDMEAEKNDFSYSDSPHLTSQSGKPIPANEIHVPGFVWPIGILYKDFLNGKPLALSTTTIAGIFSGKINMWNDPAIVKDNSKTYTVQVFKKDKKGKPLKDKKGKPILAGTKQVTQSLKLPERPITVIYRGDSSGTTGNLLAALGQVDKTNWPTASVEGNTKVFASSDAKGAIGLDPIRFQAANGSAGVPLITGAAWFEPLSSTLAAPPASSVELLLPSLRQLVVLSARTNAETDAIPLKKCAVFLVSIFITNSP